MQRCYKYLESISVIFQSTLLYCDCFCLPHLPNDLMSYFDFSALIFFPLFENVFNDLILIAEPSLIPKLSLGNIPELDLLVWLGVVFED